MPIGPLMGTFDNVLFLPEDLGAGVLIHRVSNAVSKARSKAPKTFFQNILTFCSMGKEKSLFRMIRDTHANNPDFTVSAYSDNAAVLQGEIATFFARMQIP
jgi:phosphoribosylformylglycinamidine (FGAM) synthase-like enzyme